MGLSYPSRTGTHKLCHKMSKYTEQVHCMLLEHFFQLLMLNTCTCVSHTHSQMSEASKKQVCVSADINHFCTAAVCRSIYPQISLLKSPSNHHVASQHSQPGCLSKFSSLYVFVWQHMFALVFKRMCKCTGCLAANAGMWENVLEWVSVWLLA